MKPMRARRASEWQLSVATDFALLRERHSDRDTIHKPVGLGSGGLPSAVAVQLLSRFCPTIVQPQFAV